MSFLQNVLVRSHRLSFGRYTITVAIQSALSFHHYCVDFDSQLKYEILYMIFILNFMCVQRHSLAHTHTNCVVLSINQCEWNLNLKLDFKRIAVLIFVCVEIYCQIRRKLRLTDTCLWLLNGFCHSRVTIGSNISCLMNWVNTYFTHQNNNYIIITGRLIGDSLNMCVVCVRTAHKLGSINFGIGVFRTRHGNGHWREYIYFAIECLHNWVHQMWSISLNCTANFDTRRGCKTESSI